MYASLVVLRSDIANLLDPLMARPDSARTGQLDLGLHNLIRLDPRNCIHRCLAGCRDSPSHYYSTLK